MNATPGRLLPQPARHSVIRLAQELRMLSRVLDARTFVRYLRACVAAAPEILRSKTLGPADRRMQRGRVSFAIGDGRSVLIDGSFFSGAREICGKKVYTPTHQFRFIDATVVVDVGANVGIFSCYAACHAPAAIVYAIEAQSGFLPIIRDNAALNRAADRIIPFHALIGASTGLFAEESARRSSSHWEETPVVIDMDSFFAQHSIRHVDMMKIDIEGSEYALFADPCRWLDHVDRLAMECHPSFGSHADLTRTLEAHGLEVLSTREPRDGDIHQPHDSYYIYACRS
jgi:FkbM family methyltransferase